MGNKSDFICITDGNIDNFDLIDNINHIAEANIKETLGLELSRNFSH